MKKSLVFILLAIILTCTGNHRKTIVILGDSNAAFPKGWVYHLQKLNPEYQFLNYSVGGNTIGFNNLGSKDLNTLLNIHSYLSSADSTSNKIDMVLILLGTNDCKAVFDDRQNEVTVNMQRLIDSIRVFPYTRTRIPDIVIISPPPYGKDDILKEKYKGGDNRVRKLIPEYKKIAAKDNIRFIDIYTPLKPVFDNITIDGVHFNQEGYKKIAEIIHQQL